MRVFMAGMVLALLSGCAAVPPLTSAAGGWYTHDRIGRLEDGRVEELEKRVNGLEKRE